MRLQSIHYFRGIAILIIVAGHCLGWFNWRCDSIPGKMVSNLLTGGTVFFVFISGFLFHHVYYNCGSFDYRAFMLKKTKFLFLPYLICSLLIMAYYITNSDAAYSFREYAACIFVNLLIGKTVCAYWYIPFAMMMFLLSPLYADFMRFKILYQLIIISSLLLISGIIHRPLDNYFIPQAVIYFAPVFLLGMVTSGNIDVVYKRLNGMEIYFLLIAVSLSLIQANFYLQNNVLHKEMFEITVFDINILQKLALCFFFTVFLHRFEHGKIPIIGMCADASFAIFFLHMPILLILGKFTITDSSPWNFMLICPMVAALSFEMAYLLKMIMNSRSRYVIGW
jgi:peptidoglycan/LPS O-acetylase OafA/YrhL